MRKKIDITDKLELNGNPCLVIRGEELEVNADAATMLKVMGMFANNQDDNDQDDVVKKTQATLNMYDLLFPEKSKKLIEKKKLSFTDLNRVIEAAVDLIAGSNEPAGETQTHTTT